MGITQNRTALLRHGSASLGKSVLDAGAVRRLVRLCIGKAKFRTALAVRGVTLLSKGKAVHRDAMQKHGFAEYSSGDTSLRTTLRWHNKATHGFALAERRMARARHWIALAWNGTVALWHGKVLNGTAKRKRNDEGQGGGIVWLRFAPQGQKKASPRRNIEPQSKAKALCSRLHKNLLTPPVVWFILL